MLTGRLDDRALSWPAVGAFAALKKLSLDDAPRKFFPTSNLPVFSTPGRVSIRKQNSRINNDAGLSLSSRMSSLLCALRARGSTWFADWVGMQTFICTGSHGIQALRKSTTQVEVTDHSSVLFTSQVVNKFLFLTFAGSAVDKLKDMLDNPSQIPSFLAEALPSQSVFFICYIMLATLSGYALQLLRVVPLILVAIKRKWLAKTAREDKLAWNPPPILYDRVVSS